uniref:Uncharacterized protein n=1 Tax=Lactuca sativa TaxID=4236 RepID=A0A9R1XI73_LACSA|nr:hypothetical protein LSAT_V11C400203040 [Lactuca sativa]
MMVRGRIDRGELLSVLKGKGSKTDKLRFAIMFLNSTETIPQIEIKMVESSLREAEIKSLNVSLASANAASRSNIVDWAEKLYGQSISAVTTGVKNLLSGDHQLAMATTIEALMEGKSNNPETESYLVLDPHTPKSSSGQMKGPFKEAIELAWRQQQPTSSAKHIIYGTTEILTGAEFIDQLAVLGQKMGLGRSSTTPSASAPAPA